MPLHEVAAEASVGAKRPFEIDTRPRPKASERRHAKRFGTDVGAKLMTGERSRREAHAIYGDAVAEDEVRRQRRLNRQARTGFGRLSIDDFADCFNEAREHSLPS